jgi:WD40 repeat protein
LSVDIGDQIAHCLTFDKNTKSIAVGCEDSEIKIINIEKGEITNKLKGHEGAVNSVYINQNNGSMYSCGNEGKIGIWK